MSEVVNLPGMVSRSSMPQETTAGTSLVSAFATHSRKRRCQRTRGTRKASSPHKSRQPPMRRATRTLRFVNGSLTATRGRTYPRSPSGTSVETGRRPRTSSFQPVVRRRRTWMQSPRSGEHRKQVTTTTGRFRNVAAALSLVVCIKSKHTCKCTQGFLLH